MGVKYDENKIDWSLLSDDLLVEVIVVLMYGATKYERGGWKKIENLRQRYFSALRRHLHRFYWRREMFDPESGLLHAAQVVTNALFLLHHELEQLAELQREGFERPPITLPDGTVVPIIR